MNSRNSVTGPLVLILVGGVFLIRTVHPFQVGSLLALYWPYLLIIWGVIAFIEVTARFLRQGPIPTNGVSAGGWLAVVVVCLIGAALFEVQKPDNWWRQIGVTQDLVALGDAHQYSLREQKSALEPHSKILIESFRGDAKVTGADVDDVTLSGQKSIRALDLNEADAADRQSRVELIRDGRTLIVRCHQDHSGHNSSVTTNLELTVPKDATVEAVGTRGDFDISEIQGDVNISSSNAGVRLQDVGGRVKIETSKSDVIRCENIHGDVDLRGHGDDVELYKVGGQVTISGDYRGSVSLRELAKPVRVQNSRTQLDVQQIPGEVRLDRGSFSAQNVVGPTTLTTHSTDVTFDGFSSGLDLTVERGDVDIRPNRSPLGKIAVHATSGNIELSLPEAANFALNASTERGEIENDFGESLRESNSGKGAKLVGAVGTGPDVDLVTNHGSITVRKAAGESKATSVSGKEPDSSPENQRATTVADSTVR